MGVPGFFVWLIKNYKKNNIILSNIDDLVDTLYLDANCLFHPQCFKVLEDNQNWRSLKSLENKMFKRIENYIDFLIDIVNPKSVFISVDGVAPLAKINQQRKRRFKSIDDAELKNKIKEKHNMTINKSWSNIVITPGTEFMEKLHNRLLKYIRKRTDKKIIYSSYHTPGEGEHKILDDIKKKNNNKLYVVYGLDADLIFLTLASQKKNIYLLREKQHFNRIIDEIDHNNSSSDVSEELCYVSMDRMRECLNIKLKELIDIKNNNDININFNNLSDDFIFICYLLGNDFLPHLPSINIKNRGLDLLISCYIDTIVKLNRKLVNFDTMISIDNNFFEQYLKNISLFENKYFTKILPNYKEYLSKKKCYSTDPYEIDIWKLDNMKSIEINDPIKLGKDSPHLWKFRYYEHYFGVSEHQYEYIENMCHEYLKGIKWVSKYYFESCPSWDWQYPYNNSPFLSDIAKYYNNKNIDINEIEFGDSEPLTPFNQLLSVIPPKCSNILPNGYKKLLTSSYSPIIDMYPVKTNMDMINKEMYWKCIPLVPIIDIKRIKNSTKNIELNDDEILRNKLSDNYTNLNIV